MARDKDKTKEEHEPLAPPAQSQEPAEEGAPAWMTTFSDLMSLLLTFFVLMYSMSEIKQEKFALASTSLSEAFTGMAPVTAQTPGIPRVMAAAPVALAQASSTTDVNAATDAYLEMIARRLEEMIERRRLQDELSVVRGPDGVRLRILSTALFPSGSARVQDESRWILDELAGITAALGVPAMVSGHTDDVPIRTSQFESNWELSAARAAGVARGLSVRGQDPEELRVEAYGEYAPVADNATPEGRRQNRRVEIHFSRSAINAVMQQWIEQGLSTPEGFAPGLLAADSGAAEPALPDPAAGLPAADAGPADRSLPVRQASAPAAVAAPGPAAEPHGATPAAAPVRRPPRGNTQAQIRDVVERLTGRPPAKPPAGPEGGGR